MQANNKEISEMFGVMNSAISEIKATQGNTSKVGTTFSSVLDRMVGDLNNEVARLEDSLRVFLDRCRKWTVTKKRR